MKTLFNVNNYDNINLYEIRNKVIFLMEAFGFECTRRILPTIYIDDEVTNSCYVSGDHVILLRPEVVNGNRIDLLTTLAHEITHSLQREETLVPFGVPYHLRSSEQQAYAVQKLYQIELTCGPLKPVWKFICKYGNKKWYKQQFHETAIWMESEPAIRNHKDFQAKMEDIFNQVC